MTQLPLFANFFWDPPREAFRIPYLDHPVMWYGILFVLGLISAYFILLSMLKKTLLEFYPEKEQSVDENAQTLLDRMTWMVVLGAVIGARLGHVFFYDFDYYRQHLWEILKIWQGGLASHGGALGIIIAICLFRLSIKKNYPELTLWRIFDMFTVASPFAGALIRLGNFINQEIVGTRTELPWGVAFGNPLDLPLNDPERNLPRHPIQLYEAAAYFAIFFVMRHLWNAKHTIWQPGKLFGIFLVLLFGSRLILEFFKVSQGELIEGSLLQTGQWLSLPFIFFGIALTLIKSKN